MRRRDLDLLDRDKIGLSPVQGVVLQDSDGERVVHRMVRRRRSSDN